MSTYHPSTFLTLCRVSTLSAPTLRVCGEIYFEVRLNAEEIFPPRARNTVDILDTLPLKPAFYRSSYTPSPVYSSMRFTPLHLSVLSVPTPSAFDRFFY